MRWIPAGLSVLALCLASGLAYLWLEPETGDPRAFAWDRPAAIKPELPSLTQRPESSLPAADPAQYLAMLEKPLFAMERRPPPPPPPPQPPKVVVVPPPDPLNSLQLLGLFSGELAGIIARVDGKTRRLKVGDKVGDWALQGVDSREAKFLRGEETRAIKLASSRWGSPPSAGLPPGRSPVTQASPNAPASTPDQGSIRKQQEADVERQRVFDALRARGMLRP